MSIFQEIITLIKTKPKTAIILFVTVICLILFGGPLYHCLNKILNPTLKKSKVRIGDVELVNEYEAKSYLIIDRENPLPSTPPNNYDELMKQQANEFLRSYKIDVVTATSVSSTTIGTESHFDLIKIRDKKLKNLYLIDPNSEIISVTEKFLKMYTPVKKK